MPKDKKRGIALTRRSGEACISDFDELFIPIGSAKTFSEATMTGRLSEHDHDVMDRYLESMFESVKLGRLGRHDFVESLAYVMTALDVDAQDEARHCFERSLRDAGGAPRSEGFATVAEAA